MSRYVRFVLPAFLAVFGLAAFPLRADTYVYTISVPSPNDGIIPELDLTYSSSLFPDSISFSDVSYITTDPLTTPTTIDDVLSLSFAGTYTADFGADLFLSDGNGGNYEVFEFSTPSFVDPPSIGNPVSVEGAVRVKYNQTGAGPFFDVPGNFTLTITDNAPEPGTLGLASIALGGIALALWRRKR